MFPRLSLGWLLFGSGKLKSGLCVCQVVLVLGSILFVSTSRSQVDFYIFLFKFKSVVARCTGLLTALAVCGLKGLIVSLAMTQN